MVEHICDYGCGQEATKYFPTTKKWCCSKNTSQCPAIRKKLSEDRIEMKFSNKHRKNLSKSHRGQKGYWTGKHRSEFSIEKMKKSMKGKEPPNKLTIEQIEEKYPLFSNIEELRYNPNNPIEIQCHCKNNNCIYSKENNGWFTPKRHLIFARIRAIKLSTEDVGGGSYIYCSEECKDECSLFNKKVTQLIKEDQIKAGIIKKEYYTSKEYNIWRTEVLKRANYKCEYCGEKAIHCHHSRPQKLEPFFSLDPDYGIACCIKCHYEKGHKEECSTGQISQKVCI